MLRKSFTLKKPLDDYAVPLEMFLGDVARNALRSASGTYTGDGKTSHKIAAPFNPTLVLIHKTADIGKSTFPLANTLTVAILKNAGVAWVSDTGFVTDAVISAQNDGFTVGSNSNVNAENVSYTYFIVG